MAVTLACYLPYRVFDDWWYIRFLLPAVPLLIILSIVVLARFVRGAVPRAHAPVLVLVVVLMAGWWLHVARAGHAFELSDFERHFRDAGTAVAERLPPGAVIITVKNSGSVHYYASRPTVSWDVLDPAWLEPAVAFLGGQGYVPYLLLESEEEPQFRVRFEGTTPLGGLDWPPAVQVDRAIRIYDPRDRARYFANEAVRTEYIWRRHEVSP